MKHVKKILLGVLIVVMAMSMSLTAFAAVKKGLVKKGGKYYYYKSGKMVRNTWKTVKKNRYYFGKNGAAYKAAKPFDGTYNVKICKIKGKKYGFDAKSHLVAEGTYVDDRSRIWVFTGKGRLDDAKTAELRSMFPADQISADLYDRVITAFGEPATPVEYAQSCGGWNQDDSFKDVIITYKYFQVQLILNETAKTYKFTGFFSVKA